MKPQTRADAAFKTFRDFYAFYLQEHARRSTQIMHVLGTLSFVGLTIAAMVLWTPWLALVGVAAGYAFAWMSHFLMERNKPATFRRPLWSAMADFRLCYELLSGRRRLPRPAALTPGPAQRRRPA